MTVEFKEIELAASQLANIMDQVPKQIKRLEKEIELCDLETSDLLHLIELSTFNASEGYRLSRDLQITRQKRRECKDELESLTQFQHNMTKHRPMDHQVSTMCKLSDSRKKALANRNYRPRVRTELTEKFNECKKNKVFK